MQDSCTLVQGFACQLLVEDCRRLFSLMPATSTFGVTAADPHSGTFDAEFGASGGQNDYISQNLATTAGTYDVNFWLNLSENANGQFVALWNGVQFFTFVGGSTLGVLPATGPSQLKFGGNTPRSFYHLDDISVVRHALATIPEPSSLLLMFSGLLGLGGKIFRRFV